MAASTRIAVALLVTLLTLVASACSTKRTALVAPPTSAPIRHVLFNGVRVIIEEHRTSDVVAVQLWVKAGGRDEVANELGLAHYLEHMLFKGTPTRPRSEEHTSELQSRPHLVCRLLLEKKKREDDQDGHRSHVDG